MRAPHLRFLADTIAEQWSQLRNTAAPDDVLNCVKAAYHRADGMRPLSMLEGERAYTIAELAGGLPSHSPAECVNGLQYNCASCIGYYLKRLTNADNQVRSHFTDEGNQSRV